MKQKVLNAVFILLVFCSFNCTTKSAFNKAENPRFDYEFQDDNFEAFLSTFLNECYFGKSFDKMLVEKDETIRKHLFNDNICRYYNPGSTCVTFCDSTYGYPKNHPFKEAIMMENPKYFKDILPNDGFCEESNEAEGIYYIQIDEYPSFPTFIPDGDFVINYPVLSSSDDPNWKKMKVQILYNEWIIKTFIFTRIDNNWYFTFVYDCDCSS